MLNVLITGIGGQGTVLAAKLLAQAAKAKGWQVRTAETIGMAQRGGSVVSHVRMGNHGEVVNAPLLNQGTADLIVAFEPGEAGRCLSYLSSKGTLVTATGAVQPITDALTGGGYNGADAVAGLHGALDGSDARLIVMDAGPSKTLNVMLLAKALDAGTLPLSVDDLREAVKVCVKPQFVEMDLNAIDATVK